MSAHCTTEGYATREHSSFSVMWSRQLLVFPEDHCEQALNPQLVGSRPTAGLYSNIQICEARRRKLLRRGEKNANLLFSILLRDLRPIAFCSCVTPCVLQPLLLFKWVPLWNAFKLTHLYTVPYNHIRHAFSLTVDLRVYGIRKAFFIFHYSRALWFYYICALGDSLSWHARKDFFSACILNKSSSGRGFWHSEPCLVSG